MSDLVFHTVVKRISLPQALRFSGVFRARRVTAVIGGTTIWRSAMLRLAAGLLRPDDGRVLGPRALYYGGFPLLPAHGSVNLLRRGLGLARLENGDRRLGTLSRSECQSVGLDIAFDLSPPALILADPWTALPFHARSDLDRRLAAYAASGRVVILDSEDADDIARVADDLVVLTATGPTFISRESRGAARFDSQEIRALASSARGAPPRSRLMI
ncbi:MAG TPA: hypothetical protein VF618_09155 [Thermoanaerobaculia bacterium]